MSKLPIAAAVAWVTIGGAQMLAAADARAANTVVFKIWNDTTVPITQIYDKDSRQSNWGINDVTTPIEPGHYFYIKFEENSYAHCPTMLHDVRIFFANGKAKLLTKINVCEYDVHVHKP